MIQRAELSYLLFLMGYFSFYSKVWFDWWNHWNLYFVVCFFRNNWLFFLKLLHFFSQYYWQIFQTPFTHLVWLKSFRKVYFKNRICSLVLFHSVTWLAWILYIFLQTYQAEPPDFGLASYLMPFLSQWLSAILRVLFHYSFKSNALKVQWPYFSA